MCLWSVNFSGFFIYTTSPLSIINCLSSGAEGSRTPGLLNAIQALSQLSYSPVPLKKRTSFSIRISALSIQFSWLWRPWNYNRNPQAGVVKLVDAGDSKSPFPWGSVGSIPTSGTRKIEGLAMIGWPLFFEKSVLVNICRNNLPRTHEFTDRAPFVSTHFTCRSLARQDWNVRRLPIELHRKTGGFWPDPVPCLSPLPFLSVKCKLYMKRQKAR